MKEYQTIDIVPVFCGFVGMSEKQASRRAGRIKPVKDQPGVYEVLKPVQFKVGEVVFFDNPDKVTLSKLEAVPEVKKKAKAK